MRILLRMAGAAMLWTGVARAHEHWILLEPAGGRATVRIGSGHGFPSSEYRLAERLLADMNITAPDGTPAPLRPTARDRDWTAEFDCGHPGVWRAEFALKKPQEDEPMFRARGLAVIGDADEPARYATGKGLEIVPKAPLSTLRKGDSLPVDIRLDGKPIEGKIAVTPAQGAVAFYSTGRERPANIKLASGGTYLLAVSHRGRSFALTFTIRESAP